MIEFSKHPNQRKVFRLATQLVIPHPLEEVFKFFSDAENLEKITPPLLCFKIVTPQPIDIKEGTLIDYRLKIRGIPVKWRTKIANWEPPHQFIDSQLWGPYRKWEHLHTFEETKDGTLMKDQVDYSVFGGRLIERIFVRPDIKKIFTFRNEEILRRFAK